MIIKDNTYMKVSECLRRHDACVYCIVFPNGKCYVGRTFDLSERFRLYSNSSNASNKFLSAAFKEFDISSVEVNILFGIRGCKREDVDLCLSLMEIKYIRELNTLSPNGYNVSLGGEILGIPVEYLTTDAAMIKSLRSSNKVVLEYDLEGKFVREYESINRCAYEKGVTCDDIRPYLTRESAFRGLCYLRQKKYDYIPDSIDVAKCVTREKVKVVHKTVVKEKVVTKTTIENPVIVYDRHGDFVGEYISQSEAARQLGVGYICVGRWRSGYIAYKKVSNDYPKKVEGKDELYGYVLNEEYTPKGELELSPTMKEYGTMAMPHKWRKLKLDFGVGQYTFSNQLIKEYANIRAASEGSGIRYSQIWACVNGRTQQAGGYVWKKMG